MLIIFEDSVRVAHMVIHKMQPLTWQHHSCELCSPLGKVRSLTFKRSLFLEQEERGSGILSVVSHCKTVHAILRVSHFMSALQDLPPEVVPSQEYHTSIGLVLNGYRAMDI
jgi:hypothetical protein